MWLEDDHDKALAWQTHEAGLCPGCRQPIAECMADGMHQEYDTTLRICHACADRQRTEKAERNKRKDRDLPPGAWFVTRRRSPDEAI